jgi:hypothetical protein
VDAIGHRERSIKRTFLARFPGIVKKMIIAPRGVSGLSDCRQSRAVIMPAFQS